MAAKPLLDEPYVPQAIAGVLTTKCECGWEIVSLMPEEASTQICLIFNHIQSVHGLKLPVFTCNQF